ncbi:MAG: hypothetical protein LBD91_00765 [Prevotellaceae bacterium]|jgi:hypothetical protein|nr:hypothetical protein [Prevotellaceae bacterium]
MHYILCILCVFSLTACERRQGTVEWEAGDLLFQSIRSELGSAIEEVTAGAGERSFSHVGMLVVDSADRWHVIEAIGNSVQLTPVDTFLQRGTTVVARLKAEYHSLLPAAIVFALQQLGTPYDDAYLYDNGKYYCSELIYDAFLFANHGRPFFTLEPMTFKSPVTGEWTNEWLQHYNALGIPIPEGKPGCNPTGLSRSDKLEMKRRVSAPALRITHHAPYHSFPQCNLAVHPVPCLFRRR